MNPDGSEDHKLKIKDLPSIAIGDWRASTNSEIILEDEVDKSIEAEDDGYLYTAEEVANGIPNIQLSKKYVTTDTDTYTDLNPDSDSSYDDDINEGTEDADMNM